MRKINLIIIFCLLFVGCSKYPQNHPELIIENNGINFETKVNEGSWFENTGNSFISTSECDIAKNIEAVDVKANDKLTLKLGYTNDISKMYAYEVKESNNHMEKIPIDIIDNCIQAPKEKGEYVYSVKVWWGESTSESEHYVSYVIKLKVD